MRDVIQSVLATEAEAESIVATARIEADRILSEAQKQSQDMIARAGLEARAEAERIVEAAVNEAGQEKQERLARATVEIENQIQLEKTARARAVDGVLRCVCGRP